MGRIGTSGNKPHLVGQKNLECDFVGRSEIEKQLNLFIFDSLIKWGKVNITNSQPSGGTVQRFVIAIRKSIHEQNWLAALFLALAVPDICGTLEQPPTGKRGETEARYCKWFNRYLKKKYDPDPMAYDIIEANSPNALTQLNEQEVSLLKSQPPSPSQKGLFTAQDCYRFRCRCLHEGLLKKEDGEKFVFIDPPPNGCIVHRCSLYGVFQLQVDVFCEDICLGVEQWIEDVKQNQAVISRMQELIQISHYDILSPFIKFNRPDV